MSQTTLEPLENSFVQNNPLPFLLSQLYLSVYTSLNSKLMSIKFHDWKSEKEREREWKSERERELGLKEDRNETQMVSSPPLENSLQAGLGFII